MGGANVMNGHMVMLYPGYVCTCSCEVVNTYSSSSGMVWPLMNQYMYVPTLGIITVVINT